MADELISSLVNALADRQVDEAQADVQRARSAAELAEQAAVQSRAQRSVAQVTPVSTELLDTEEHVDKGVVASWCRRSALHKHRASECDFHNKGI